MNSPVRGNLTGIGVQVPSDTQLPHELVNSGTLERHPGPGLRPLRVPCLQIQPALYLLAAGVLRSMVMDTAP